MYKVLKKSTFIANEYVFNVKLLSNLPEFLGVNNVAIMEELHVSRSTYLRWKDNATIPMNLLIKLCNNHNMRISWFITPSNCSFNVPSVHKHMNKPWHFEFNKEAILSHFGPEEIPWREASRLTGHSRSSLYSWCQEDATVSQVLFMLNTFIIPITDVISDNTLKDIDCSESYMKKTILEQQNIIDKLMSELQNKKKLYANEVIQFVAVHSATYNEKDNKLV